MIKGTCPVCSRVFKVDDRYAGQTGRCKSCGGVVTVPGEPDEGLDGLPGVPEGADMAPAAPPAASQTPQPAVASREGEAPAEPPRAGDAPAEPRPQGTQDGSAGASPSQAPAQPPAADAGEPASPVRVLDEPTATHDARSRYEPTHGPTAMESAWLTGEPGASSGTEAEDAGPHADDVLPSKRILTTVESASAGRRPVIITIACIVLGLVGMAYAVRFVTGGPLGVALAAIGLGLAAIGVVRLWTGHWDGVVLAVLFCLCDIGISLLIVYAKTPDGQVVGFTRELRAFLGAGALALVLVLLTAVLASSRAHLGSNR